MDFDAKKYTLKVNFNQEIQLQIIWISDFCVFWQIQIGFVELQLL